MIELGHGLFIETSDELKYQQDGWHDDDLHKFINFDEFPYWLTTDDGMNPEGFTSVDKCIKELKERDCL